MATGEKYTKVVTHWGGMRERLANGKMYSRTSKLRTPELQTDGSTE